MKISTRNKQQGYSLVEVMIGAMLLAIAIVSVFQAVSQGMRISKKDFLRRRAYLHLEQILENPENSYKGNYYEEAVIHPNGPSNLAQSKIPLDSVLLDDRETSEISQHLYGYATLEITDISTSTNIGGNTSCCNNVDGKKLRATVRWNDQGEQDSVYLETIVTLVNIN